MVGFKLYFKTNQKFVSYSQPEITFETNRYHAFELLKSY